MGESESQVDLSTASIGAVADALKLEHLAVAAADAGDHVADEAAHQALPRPGFTRVVGTPDDHALVVDLELESRRDSHRELALRAFDLHSSGGNVHLDAGRQLERNFA